MVVRRFGRCAAHGVILSVGLLTLGGCSSSSLLSGVYGDASDNSASQGTVAAQATPARPYVVDFDPESECPQVNIPTGASFYGNSKGSQLVISNFARECVLSGAATVTIKIGVEGHVASTGGGGNGFSGPLRITVRDRDERVVYTRAVRVTAHPGEDGINRFKTVEETAPIPISYEKPLRHYEILVGFDGKAMPGNGARYTPGKRRG